MNAAIAEAQASFGHFTDIIAGHGRNAEHPVEVALVKYAFQATKAGAKVEHVFLGDVHDRDDALWGVVNADPAYTDEVSEGDVVRIDSQRVSDWLYVIDGRGTGGFTFRLMWKHFSPEEKAAYGSQPPFLWLVNGTS